jgi:hypothetical protein
VADVSELCVLITGADAVYFLCTDTGPHITGTLLEVTGGHEWEP